jgi:DnaJ-class molecular chaperone
MEKHRPGDTCAKCGKPVVAYPCLTCSGKGFTRTLFRRNPCPNCAGTGSMYQCPDHYKHLQSRSHEWLSRSRIPATPTSPSFTQPAKQRCSLCGGTGGIEFHGRAGPCPRCGGTGRV